MRAAATLKEIKAVSQTSGCCVPCPLAFGVLFPHFTSTPWSLLVTLCFPWSQVSSVLYYMSFYLGSCLVGEIPWVAPPGGILWYALETFSVATVSNFISFHLLSVLVCMPPFLMACCLLPSALGDPNCISLVFMFPMNVLLLKNDNYTCLIHHWHPSAIVTPAICGCWAPTVLWLNICRILRTPGFP